MMKWANVKMLLGVLLVLALVFVSACGGGTTTDDLNKGEDPPASSDDGNQSDPGDVQEDVTIRFSNWAQSDTYDRVNEAFTEDFPNITVEWVFSNGHGAGHFANILN